MIQFRHGVFETNSSSSHSIIISTQGDYYTKEEIERSVRYDNDEGLIYFWTDELEFYRYPFDILSSFGAKLRYVIASYGWNQEIPEEVYDICREVIDGFKGFHFPRAMSWDDEDEEKEYHGDIDHQSESLLKSFLKKYDVTLREFLLNKKYVVIIDGDEIDVTDRLLNLSFVDNDRIDKFFGIYGELERVNDSD